MFCIKGATALWYSYFGHGQAPHILSGVRCSLYGSYSSLLQCSYNTLDATMYCGDSAVASVICVGKNIVFFFNLLIVYSHAESCTDGTVRLSGSPVKNSGHVEICIETTWTSLCVQSWDFKDAQVVCKELGYSPYGITNKSLCTLQY